MPKAYSKKSSHVHAIQVVSMLCCSNYAYSNDNRIRGNVIVDNMDSELMVVWTGENSMYVSSSHKAVP